MKFSSFQSRLTVFFASLLAIVLLSVFWVVNQKNIENAENTILVDLEITSSAFAELRKTRTDSLFDIVGTATRDFAFLRAIATNDKKTIVDAMNNNIIDRIYSLLAEYIFLLDSNGELIASTNEKFTSNPWPWLLEAAALDEYNEVDSIVIDDQKALQVIVLPIQAKGIDAWIIVGFAIDQVFISDTRKITGRDLSVIVESPSNIEIVASSLEASLQKEFEASYSAEMFALANQQTEIVSLQQERYVSLQREIEQTPQGKIYIVLQGSLDKALEPYQRLNKTLFIIFLSALILAMLVIIWLASSMSKPLVKLTKIVRQIDKGDYTQRVKSERVDELGVLADSVNNMAQGLSEKEQVRNLLGKVVSNEIATELLSKKVELGGEEKVVTVLFSDVRDFTAMCEGMSPTEILNRLNRYFNRVSLAIEKHKGVVDKYIGDAIMALYGAPVSYEDCADKAISSAIDMLEALNELNEEFSKEGIAALGMGIGINSGEVVVGNMGSENRMNYTVIGDNVNLASRLEGLTKYYACSILISERTKELSTRYVLREVDTVKVKGKQEAVTIYEPVCLYSELSSEMERELKQHAKALSLYRSQSWGEAVEIFSGLSQQYPNIGLYEFYKNRCKDLINNKQHGHWQAITVLENK